MVKVNLEARCFCAMSLPTWASNSCFVEKRLPVAQKKLGAMTAPSSPLQDPECAELIPDRAVHTGDLATIDDEGYCNIVGRIKDMVIRGGENVYPREIEEFLYRHPNVQDVQVIGVPDRHYGEELCAWVRLRDGETATVEEIRDFCRGQIAHYKIPRYVRFVDGFPMTVTGKIQKFVMREQMITELRLAIEKTA